MSNATEVALQQWMAQIEQVCMNNNDPCVNLIVDQAGDIPPLVEDLKWFKPEIRWRSLLEGQPENEFIDDAPLLLQLRTDIWQQKEWFSALLRQYRHPSRVLLLFSSHDFEQLARYLQRLTIAQWDERKGVMRFYDTRIFPKLLESILSEQQKQYFLDAAQLWSWRNRDGNSVWTSGGDQQSAALSDEVSLVFDDNQFSLMGYLSDIQVCVDRYSSFHPDASSEELFQYLWESLVAQNKQQPVVDSERFFNECLLRKP